MLRAIALGVALLLAGPACATPDDEGVLPIPLCAEARAPAACTVTAPISCPDPAPTYADVEGIFQARCVTCHDGKHGQWPLRSYQHVSDWGDEVRGAVLSCAMPPSDSCVEMPLAERELVLAWARCGFLE